MLVLDKLVHRRRAYQNLPCLAGLYCWKKIELLLRDLLDVLNRVCDFFSMAIAKAVVQ